MAATIPQTTAPAAAPQAAELPGRYRLLQPSRGYAVTHNPFAVWEVLPTITLAFAGMAAAMLFISDSYLAGIAVGAFLVATLGVLLIPAVALKGSLNLTHEGVIFERGRHNLTASWSQVVGIANRRDCGLTLLLSNPQQTAPRMRLPGGFCAENGQARIPLRMFGDRQFSILYDIRDRLPEATWRPALEAASRRSTGRILAVYAATVAVCGLALFAVVNVLS
jgi:hypothetical protein